MEHRQTERPGSQPQQRGGKGPVRVLTLCDGVGAVLRLAAYTAQLPSDSLRTDLSLSAAQDHLRDSTLMQYDLVVIAPAEETGAAPRALEAVLALAAEKSLLQVVLMPLRAPPLRIERPGLRVLYGPPFTGRDAVSGAAAAPLNDGAQAQDGARRSGLLPLGLFRRAGRQEETGGPASGGAAPRAPHVIAVQPLAGGVGATTVAVNLARALASGRDAPRVCLLDLDLQFGAVSSYFDLPVDARSLELYRAPAGLDGEAFRGGLREAGGRLRVFAAPPDIIPVDGISGRDVAHLVRLAREIADVVVLDMPCTISDWTEDALRLADRILGIALLDIRAVRNLRRMKRLLEPALFAPPLFRPVLNRVPRRPGREWAGNLRTFEAGIGAGELLRLNDGGLDLQRSCDSGTDPAAFEAGNPFLTGIRALAADFAAGLPQPEPQPEVAR